MCGRFVRTSTAEEVAAYFDARLGEVELGPSVNVAPTDDVDAVVVGRPSTPAEGRRLVAAFRWGLVPSWADDLKIGARMINARAETVVDKPAFRTAFRQRRCLVPADGYYEWRRHPEDPKRRQPYLVRRRDGEQLAFAGLWERWRDDADPDAPAVRSVAIVTTRINEALSGLHDRMPVVVDPGAWAEWLDPHNDDVDALGRLLAPAPEDLLAAHAVDPAVGKVTNRDPHLVDPVQPKDPVFPAVLA